MTASTAFTLHFPFVHDIEAALFARAPAAKLQGKPVYMEATVKAFNMSASYATSFGCGAREQIQNWFDQCRVTVSDRSPDFVQVEPAVYSETLLRYKIREAKLYVGTGEQQILGILLEATDQEGRQLLLLKKYGAQMTLDSLILGESSKRNDKYLAGQFGEGAKVEINRLVQEGCTVQYWTGNAAWTFQRLAAQGCRIPELHVIVQPGPDLCGFVAVAVIASPDYPGRLLEQQRYLFLQGTYCKLSSQVKPSLPWSGLELLLDKAHWGKVHIQGIFVVDAPTYVCFGLNYTGDKSIFSYLKLGRGRDALDARLLVFGVPAMLTDLRQRSQTEFQKAIAVIYELMSQPDTELASIPAFSRYNCFVRASEDQRSLAQALCEHFKGIHQNALPACSTFTARSNHAEAEDLKYLGFRTAEVPETVYLLFKKAGLLQSQEQLWELKKLEILALPDPLESMTAERREPLDRLCEELESKFSKFVKPGQIIFKTILLAMSKCFVGSPLTC